MSRSRRPNFSFCDVGIERGAVFEPDFRDDRNQRVTVFWKHEKEKVTVAGPKEVLCDGIRISFRKLTGILLDKIKRKPATGFTQCGLITVGLWQMRISSNERNRQLDRQDKVMEQQGKALEQQITMSQQHGKALEQQITMSQQHGKALEQQGKALEQQGKVLEQQITMLQRQDTVMERQDKALQRKTQSWSDRTSIGATGQSAGECQPRDSRAAEAQCLTHAESVGGMHAVFLSVYPGMQTRYLFVGLFTRRPAPATALECRPR